MSPRHVRPNISWEVIEAAAAKTEQLDREAIVRSHLI